CHRLYPEVFALFAQLSCAGAPGACGHPAFPAPSLRRADEIDAKLGREMRREEARCLSGEGRLSSCLAPHAGRGRIASPDAIRVRGSLRALSRHLYSRTEPLIPTFSP